MEQPTLTIIAGCNGSGKSTYSTSLVSSDIKPFDYDKRFLGLYRKLPDSELREDFARQQTTKELEDLIAYSLRNNSDCCFETNLMNMPFDWIRQFRLKGFCVEVYFFCLNSIEKAKERVMIRTKNDGHYVSDDIVEIKWREGYKNINQHFSEFDKVTFIDNSVDGELPEFIVEIVKAEESALEINQYVKFLPGYFERRLPSIFELLN